MEKLLFELVSPERVLISEPVSMAVIPGSEGYFGALPQHAPMISALAPGVVDIYQESEIVNRLFVSGGVVELNAEKCTLLADEALPLAEMDSAKAALRLEEAENILSQTEDELDRKDAEAKVKIAQALVQAIAGSAK